MAKIITIRGTSGSGKTTLVREIMKLYGSQKELFIEGRKTPIGQLLSKKGQTTLFIPGNMRNVCGGCDTIKLRSDVFKLVGKAHKQGFDVLFEGVICSDEVPNTVALNNDGMLIVIGLATSIEECIKRINQRRRQRNPDLLPLDPKNTTNRNKNIVKAIKRLQAAGVRTMYYTNEEAYKFIRKELGV